MYKILYKSETVTVEQAEDKGCFNNVYLKFEGETLATVHSENAWKKKYKSDPKILVKKKIKERLKGIKGQRNYLNAELDKLLSEEIKLKRLQSKIVLDI